MKVQQMATLKTTHSMRSSFCYITLKVGEKKQQMSGMSGGKKTKIKNTVSGREICGRIVFQESKASNEMNFKTCHLSGCC